MAISIGRAIKLIREAQGRSLGVVAREAKMSVPYLSLVENDKRNPSLDALERIADVLSIPMETFLIVSVRSDSRLVSEDDTANRLVKVLENMDAFEAEIRAAVADRL